MSLTNTKLDFEKLDQIIDFALQEDILTGDITTDNLIPEDKRVSAYMKAKGVGVIAGLFVAEKVFKKLDRNIIFNELVKDGDFVKAGTIICKMEGSYRAILSGERLALNFLQRMSGIATKTRKFVEAIKDFETKILDTRKTLPCLRMLDKYSVKTGGGENHRIGLFDMVMIKDNHIDVAGGITNAVRRIRENVPPEIKIEVETKNLDEVKEALSVNADIIMLDNMSIDEMREAVEVINKKAIVEASGNLNLERLKEVASTGVDYISVGALTHSVEAFDIGQYIEKEL